jgi:hypothetical protein
LLEHASMFGLLDPHSLKTMLILCWLRLPKFVENYISDQLCRALLKVHSHCLFTGVLHVLLCLWIPSSNVLPCPLFIERGGICFNSLTKCLSIVSSTSACLTLFNSLTKFANRCIVIAIYCNHCGMKCAGPGEGPREGRWRQRFRDERFMPEMPQKCLLKSFESVQRSF